MQNNKIFLKGIVFLGCILLFSCKNSKDIPIIDLNRIDQSISLDLNDILKDISVVQISKDKLLHSVNDKIYVTSQYLIIYSDKFSKTNASMDLFNRKGELIRNLAVRGNGPGEFNIIENFFVDEQERILYYTDMRDRSILNRIEISNGVALEPLQIDFNYLTMNFINEKVYSLPNIKGFFKTNEYPDSAIVLRSTSIPSGDIQEYKGDHNYSLMLLGSTLASYKEEVILLNLGYSDTLFNLKNNKLSPICVLPFPNKMTDYTKGGSLFHVISAYNNGIVLAKINVEYRPPMTIIYKNEYFALYDRKGNISKIDNTNVMNTKIDLTEPGTYIYSSLPIICGNYGYMLVEHDVLGTQKDIDPDNDNPIIITGKLK